MAVESVAPALEVEEITKSYPGVLALDRISFAVNHGEIHALLGENGAGKSTLVKLLMGATQPDSGVIRIDGKPAHMRSPRDARAHGIAIIPQEVDACSELSVGRNVLLGRERALVRRSALATHELEQVRESLSRVGADIELGGRAGDLNVPALRLAQIAHAIVTECHVMLCDEPTAVLSEADADAFLEYVVRSRSESRRAIVYVTHRLSEVLQIADRITVLRDGKNVGTFHRHEVDRAKLIELMTKTGQKIEARELAVGGGVVRRGTLAVSQLSAERQFEDITLSVESGKIVGIAGVQGAGQGALLAAVAGRHSYDVGSVTIDGMSLPAGNARLACKAGLAFVPADRRRAAIVPPRSLRENISLPVTGALARFGFRARRSERRLARVYSNVFDIRGAGPESAAGELSGGNQQKLALARVVQGAPRFLLLDEPTQGIDVGGKAEVRAIIGRLVNENGLGVLVASSEFEDLLGFADEIHVMRLGRLVTTFDGKTATYADLLHEALP